MILDQCSLVLADETETRANTDCVAPGLVSVGTRRIK